MTHEEELNKAAELWIAGVFLAYSVPDTSVKELREIAEKSFIAGYQQAEKDLSMTIDDLELLHTFLYAVKNNKSGCFTFTRLSDEQYQEVLRRFNERKK